MRSMRLSEDFDQLPTGELGAIGQFLAQANLQPELPVPHTYKARTARTSAHTYLWAHTPLAAAAQGFSLASPRPGVDAINQWFENFGRYEVTLEEIVAASLDVNSKEELSATIEQCEQPQAQRPALSITPAVEQMTAATR
ncbi:hypothetical protein EDB92DRAFT_1468273 [Lactarius akahatsu]|uniref:Uncharacterized protein n=1 Tax=Lactarius akahatsu TaxID=416441 RepID=A0AAD4L8T3_9AGAM|nr:hypothetical protein EDB92DRAFT_1468273 [Lactarius akahatsu]